MWLPLIAVRMASNAGLTTSLVLASGTASRGKSSVSYCLISKPCPPCGRDSLYSWATWATQPHPRVSGNSSAGAHSARHAATCQFKALFGQRLSQRMGRVVQPLCMECACSGATIAGHLLLGLPYIFCFYSQSLPPSIGDVVGASPSIVAWLLPNPTVEGLPAGVALSATTGTVVTVTTRGSQAITIASLFLGTSDKIVQPFQNPTLLPIPPHVGKAIQNGKYIDFGT